MNWITDPVRVVVGTKFEAVVLHCNEKLKEPDQLLPTADSEGEKER